MALTRIPFLTPKAVTATDSSASGGPGRGAKVAAGAALGATAMASLLSGCSSDTAAPELPAPLNTAGSAECVTTPAADANVLTGKTASGASFRAVLDTRRDQLVAKKPLNPKQQAVLCQVQVSARADAVHQFAIIKDSSASSTEKDAAKAAVKADVYDVAASHALLSADDSASPVLSGKNAATQLAKLEAKAKTEEGAALQKTMLAMTGQARKLDSLSKTPAEAFTSDQAAVLGEDYTALGQTTQEATAETAALKAASKGFGDAAAAIEKKLVGEATSFYRQNGLHAPETVSSEAAAALVKGTPFETVQKGITQAALKDPSMLAAQTQRVNASVEKQVGGLMKGQKPDAHTEKLVKGLVAKGASDAEIHAAVSSYVKGTRAYLFAHPSAIPHQDLLHWGLSGVASDRLRFAGISGDRIMQTIGDAAASGGTHAEDGTIHGAPYTAAVDISVRGWSDAQIREKMDTLAKLGFAAYYRNPGHDGWPSSEVVHMHAIYTGVPMKSALKDQVNSWLRGGNGLAYDAPYGFFKWSAADRAIVHKTFNAAN